MIFGALPAVSKMFEPAVQAAKQAVAQAALVPAEPDFFTANKTALLVGGGVALAGTLGYVLWKRKKKSRRNR